MTGAGHPATTPVTSVLTAFRAGWTAWIPTADPALQPCLGSLVGGVLGDTGFDTGVNPGFRQLNQPPNRKGPHKRVTTHGGRRTTYQAISEADIQRGPVPAW